MLQSVPVLFQRFTILTGDSLRHRRDKLLINPENKNHVSRVGAIAGLMP